MNISFPYFLSQFLYNPFNYFPFSSNCPINVKEETIETTFQIKEESKGNIDFLKKEVEVEEKETIENHQKTNQPTFEAYQNQYLKNYTMVRFKLKTPENLRLCLTQVFQCTSILNKAEKKETKKKKIKNSKIYCFLCSLAFYEVDSKKNHESFELQDWVDFASTSLFLNYEEIMKFKVSVFKQKQKSFTYKWTVKDDECLKKLYKKYQNNKYSWLIISEEFNKCVGISSKRRPKECFERWKNTLKKSYVRGDWTRDEDFYIMSYVSQNGTKWSKLADLMHKRTEHNIKNRFFRLVSQTMDMNIRTIKKSVNYKNPKVSDDVLKYLKNKYDPID